MSIKFDNVKLELQPFGPTAGARAVTITVSEDSNSSPVEEIHDALTGQIETDLKTQMTSGLTEGETAYIAAEEKAKDLFESALTGKLPILFQGTISADIASENIRADLAAYVQQGLARKAIEFQLKDLGYSHTELRPPFLIAKTDGKQYTGSAMFYENFNIVLAELDPTAEGAEFALVELSKHHLSTFIAKITDSESWTTFKGKFLNEPNCLPPVHTGRIWVVPQENNDTSAMESSLSVCKQIALEEGVRCGTNLIVP